MKYCVKFMGFVLIAFSLLTCRDEETATAPGQIQIQVDQLIQQNSSGRTALSLPSGSSLLISIVDASGNPVMTFEKITIVSFGQTSVSAPIRLKPGGYKITDFFVVNEANEVLYAIPKAGSEFARLVSRPLPFGFAVWKDRVTNVSAQVVRATESKPESFGYASFNIDIVAFPEFRLATFTAASGHLAFTDVRAYLLHDGDTIFNKHLPALSFNEIIFEGEPSDTYTLVLLKQGYAPYTQTFVLQDLKNDLQGAPLEVVLQPALTFEIAVPYWEGSSTQFVNFEMNGDDGKKVVIDWGDGTADTVTLTYSDFWNLPTTEYDHTYQTRADDTGKRFVSITGDLQNVKLVRFGYNTTIIDLSVANVPYLEHFGINFQNTLTSFEIKGNQFLNTLVVSYQYDLQQLTLENLPALKHIFMNEIYGLDTSDINGIIDMAYAAAVAGNLRDGHFDLYYDVDNFIGPPSPVQMGKLLQLRDNYNWAITGSLD